MVGTYIEKIQQSEHIFTYKTHMRDANDWTETVEKYLHIMIGE